MKIKSQLVRNHIVFIEIDSMYNINTLLANVFHNFYAAWFKYFSIIFNWKKNHATFYLILLYIIWQLYKCKEKD